MSILEILVLLIVALIVIPPERLPEVMQMVGKLLRELRLASNTIVRELSGAIDDPPYMNERVRDNPLTTPWSKSANQTQAGQEPAAIDPPPPSFP